MDVLSLPIFQLWTVDWVVAGLIVLLAGRYRRSLFFQWFIVLAVSGLALAGPVTMGATLVASTHTVVIRTEELKNISTTSSHPLYIRMIDQEDGVVNSFTPEVGESGSFETGDPMVKVITKPGSAATVAYTETRLDHPWLAHLFYFVPDRRVTIIIPHNTQGYDLYDMNR